jgi:enoyl-CoA hydratase/carnithine racemase
MTTTNDQMESLKVGQVGTVRLLTFNRPERRNAWNDGLRKEFVRQLAEADADPQVRSIVITGAGTAFCAGADMTDLAQQAGANEQEDFLHDVESPLRIRKPLIAAMNGAAVGLGLLQALYCDVRFCVADAKLSAAFPRRGFVGEFGMVSILSALAGRGRASDLLLSGRVFTGHEAYAMGVVNFLAERDHVVADALAYADDIGANCSPHAMAVIKQQIRVEPQLEFWEALRHAEALQLASLATPDVAEGFSAYFEKRKPAYEPLR